MADHVREAINAAKTYSEKVRRETRTALTAVCFFRRTENLCRIAPKTEYERGMPRYPADDTRHIFLNLNRYGEGLSRKLHSMLKKYGGEYSPKLHSMLKKYGGEYSPKLHSMLKNYGER